MSIYSLIGFRLVCLAYIVYMDVFHMDVDLNVHIWLFRSLFQDRDRYLEAFVLYTDIRQCVWEHKSCLL